MTFVLAAAYIVLVCAVAYPLPLLHYWYLYLMET